MPIHFIAPFLSGLLLFLSFPKFDLGWIAWVSLVPLFLAFIGKNLKYGFFLPFICGIVFFAAVFSWTFEIPGYKSLHHVILALFLGLYFGFFGLISNFIVRRCGIAIGLFSAPFVWVSLEYLRSNLSFLALPWNLIAHSQHNFPIVIQISSFTGAYGVSFLIVLANSAMAAVILKFSEKYKTNWQAGLTRITSGSTIALVITAICIAGFSLIYGHRILTKAPNGEKVTLSILQGNIDREMKKDPKRHAAFIMQRYSLLTRQAARDNPDLILWPEAATPGSALKNLTLYNEIVNLIREADTYFLIGSSEYPKFIRNPSMKPKGLGNTAIFFKPDGKLIGQYLKIHLVPFGEQIPFETTIPWPRFIVPEGKKSWEVPGNEFTLFDLEGHKFGAVICWEVVFPDLFRTLVNNGAKFMINLTNEGWFGNSAAPYQLAAVNVFRAVENRVFVARAANNGISCFIDPFGRITGKVKKENKDTFVEGYLTQEIYLSNKKTFFTRYGDVFVYANLAVGALMLALSLLRVRT